MTKGTYRSFDEMWRGFRNEKVFYNIERYQVNKIMQNTLPYMKQFEKEVSDLYEAIWKGSIGYFKMIHNYAPVQLLGAWALHLISRKAPTAYFDKKHPFLCSIIGGGHPNSLYAFYTMGWKYFLTNYPDQNPNIKGDKARNELSGILQSDEGEL